MFGRFSLAAGGHVTYYFLGRAGSSPWILFGSMVMVVSPVVTWIQVKTTISVLLLLRTRIDSGQKIFAPSCFDAGISGSAASVATIAFKPFFVFTTPSSRLLLLTLSFSYPLPSVESFIPYRMFACCGSAGRSVCSSAVVKFGLLMRMVRFCVGHEAQEHFILHLQKSTYG